MNTHSDSIPSAWVWSQYRGLLDHKGEEVPLAWVWSQYAPVSTISGISLAEQKTSKLDRKFLYAAAALAILIPGALYVGLHDTNSSHRMTNEEIANDQISASLAFLKEAYKITPREETEKLIIRIEKLQKK